MEVLRTKHPEARFCAPVPRLQDASRLPLCNPPHHRPELPTEHQAMVRFSPVIRGKLRTAVQWITERDTGGVLQPGDRCTKTGERVIDMLRTKHPEARTPTAASLDSYPSRPLELTPVEITKDTVTAVARRLSGGAGQGGERIRVPSTLAPAVRHGKRGA